jgi:CRISPR-associated protein Cmr4
MNSGVPATSTIKVPHGKYLGGEHGSLFLEERQFEREGKMPAEVVQQLTPLMLSSAGYLPERLVVLADDDFAWYEETIPPDALFYSLIAERDAASAGSLEAVLEMFKQRPYLQAGGNETVGQGWFAIRPLAATGGAA